LAASAALSAGLVLPAARAAVTQDNFPPKTTADLVALCSAQKDDPLATAALNYCHGFAEGAVEIALSYSAVGPQSHRPFCLPSPAPSHDQAVSDFSTWANGDPKRLAQPAAVGLISFLIDHYPCPHRAAVHHGHKK
jgi:hypothetical protein